GKQLDQWIRISEADLAFLTSDATEFVAQRYQDAMNQATDFARTSAAAQLELFRRLDVRKDLAEAALARFAVGPPADLPRVLLFSGHMVDDETRAGMPRFPNTPTAIARARELIRKEVKAEAKLAPKLLGIAGAACGGDILFHQICEELGIYSRVLLAL